MFARIDRRAASVTGGGAWDVWAWRGDEYLFLESKQHKSTDTLRPGQLAWLEAAIDEGVTRYAIVEYDAPKLAEPRASDAEASIRTRPTRTTGSSRSSRAVVPDLPAGLADLLAAANAATPATRIEFRGPIAAFGADAVPPLSTWIRAGTNAGFAVGTLERITRDGHPEAVAALKRLKPQTTGTVRSDIEDALRRLGTTR